MRQRAQSVGGVRAQLGPPHTSATGSICTEASPGQQGGKYVTLVHDVSSTYRIHRQKFMELNITRIHY